MSFSISGIVKAMATFAEREPVVSRAMIFVANVRPLIFQADATTMITTSRWTKPTSNPLMQSAITNVLALPAARLLAHSVPGATRAGAILRRLGTISVYNISTVTKPANQLNSDDRYFHGGYSMIIDGE